MRILEITLMPPGKKSGGELGIYQSIYSLSTNGKVDYIGPDFNGDLFGNNVKKLFILSSDNKASKYRRIKNYLFEKASTSYYMSWKRIENNIDWNLYDIVHIEFSRYEFIVKQVHKNAKKVIVRVHNIEADYGYNIFRITRKLRDYLRYYSFKTNEKMVMKDADGFVFLTKQDIEKAMKKYGIKKSKIFLNPECMEERFVVSKKFARSDEKIHILMTGSLNYEPNEKGIIWFLEYVRKELLRRQNVGKYYLTIAGAGATNKIVELIHSIKNVNFVDTPENMHPYFENADIYVASVFSGAGMKVKVAESLSYGVPVIGTDCALVGYDMDMGCIMVVNSQEEFISAILKTGKLSDKCREIIQVCFKKKYSMDSSVRRYRTILNHYVEEDDGHYKNSF